METVYLSTPALKVVDGDTTLRENQKPKNVSMMKEPGKGHRDSTYSIRFSKEVMVREQADYGDQDAIDKVYETNTQGIEKYICASDTREDVDDRSQEVSDASLQNTQLEHSHVPTNTQDIVAYWQTKTKTRKKKKCRKLRRGKRLFTTENCEKKNFKCFYLVYVWYVTM